MRSWVLLCVFSVGSVWLEKSQEDPLPLQRIASCLALRKQLHPASLRVAVELQKSVSWAALRELRLRPLHRPMEPGVVLKQPLVQTRSGFARNGAIRGREWGSGA